MSKAKGKSVLANSDETLGQLVRITCKGADTIDIEELTNFQGNLKTLSEESYHKLRRSIIDLGVSFPINVWKFRNKKYIIDAHQRIAALKKMRDEEGFRVPKLPVVWVEADSKEQAAKKVLAATSQFGEIQPEGLHAFMTEFNIGFGTLVDNFKFPEIKFMEFGQEYFKKDIRVTEYLRSGPGEKTDEEWKDMPEFSQEDKTAFRTITLHFHDQEGLDKFEELIEQKITDKTRSIWYPEIIIEKASDKRYGHPEA